MFLEISQNSQENTCVRVYFLVQLQASAYNFIKIETLAQVFSCEFFEISKNTFCYRRPLVAASELHFNKPAVQMTSEAVVLRRSVEKVSLGISQNSQENTCARPSFLIKL